MADFVRRKQVTDPLDDQAKARLVGVKHLQLSYGNSGSKHSDEGDNSPCLSKLVHDFLEDFESENQQYTSENGLHLELVDSVSDCTDVLEDIIRSAIINNVDSYEKLLIVHVSEAVETFSFLRSNVSLFRRKVMVFLRELGHKCSHL
ncbi:DUF506 family protein [Quillaja saponaria]|uniref:DUF506 family protein n=1 Tax=Quillaja saponaria TaxID=32244 RepID=A0AAD7L372_QUISA|nr:DUF506 family protein [Quillaja saponaria]